MPPRWLRRLLLPPLVLLLTLVVTTTMPVWLIALAALSSLPVLDRSRVLRVVWFVVLYLLVESIALVALFGLWIAAGFGVAIRAPWSERAHYWLVSRLLAVLYREAQRVLRLSVEVEGPDPASYAGKPLVVCCRHAGPGDSLLLVHALVNIYDREPRIVVKDTLQWDPVIDVVLHRLPNRFVDPDPGRTGEVVTAQIAQLASNLDGDDALVIFPEGGNFSEHRRARAIARLRDGGRISEAEHAERLRHVLAPRPGGLLAALERARDADVLWVAHTGLDRLHSVADVWRELPVAKRIQMRWWQVPASEVPDDGDQQVAWLWSWWTTIDEWITERSDRRAP
ncbi:lysophospholipid acyltransferase family protein [soil metagenome]